MERIAIVGLGLIGGSIGLGLKRANLPDTQIVGTARTRDTLQRAKKVQDIVPAGLAGYNESTPFQADVNKAKSLLQQAGQTAVTLELLVPTGPAPGGVATLESHFVIVDHGKSLRAIVTGAGRVLTTVADRQ